MPLSRQRRFTTPQSGETIEGLAARVLPDQPPEEAVDQIKSWNLHLFMLRKTGGRLFGCDLVFVEPPLQ